MQDEAQQPINEGDGQSPLFPYGFGLEYASRQSAYDYIGAAYFDTQSGTRAERCTDLGCGQALAYLAAGDYAMYSAVDFGSTAPATVELRLSSGASSTGSIDFRLDSPTGPTIATADVTNTGGWQSWQTVHLPVQTTATGIHDVYLVMRGNTSEDFVNLNWMKFVRA